MRSYTKAYISRDFGTLVHKLAPQDEIADWTEVAVMRNASADTACVNYNFYAKGGTSQILNWIGYDPDNNPVAFVNGVDLATRAYFWIIYSDHPLN